MLPLCPVLASVYFTLYQPFSVRSNISSFSSIESKVIIDESVELLFLSLSVSVLTIPVVPKLYAAVQHITKPQSKEIIIRFFKLSPLKIYHVLIIIR